MSRFKPSSPARLHPLPVDEMRAFETKADCCKDPRVPHHASSLTSLSTEINLYTLLITLSRTPQSSNATSLPTFLQRATTNNKLLPRTHKYRQATKTPYAKNADPLASQKKTLETPVGTLPRCRKGKRNTRQKQKTPSGRQMEWWVFLLESAVCNRRAP